MREFGWASLLALLVLGAAGASAAEQEEGPRLVHEEAGVLYEVADANRLVLRGLRGTLVLRAGQPGELRYEARTRDNRREPQPVALWLAERTLRLEALAGREGSETLLEIAVPPGLAIDLETTESAIQISALRSSLRVVGSRLELTARGLFGSAHFEIQGGKVLVSGGTGGLTLKGRDLDVTLEYAASPVDISLEKSVVSASNCQEAIEGEIETTTFQGIDLQGPLRLSAAEGSLKLERAAGGGVLELEATPLELIRTMGVLDVTTNALVTFQGHDGGLKILGYGAEVRGSGSEGVLEIQTFGAPVRLEQLGGKSEVRGDDLDLQILTATGEIFVGTTASKIVMRKVSGSIAIESEFGDIEVSEASEAIRVTSRDGNVHISGMKAPLTLSADGGEVDVGWSSLTTLEDSSIENPGGDVRVRLPSTINLRIDAEARDGLVETDLPGIEVSEDGHSASGLVGGSRAAPQAKRPTLRVRSGGDLHIGSE